MDTVVKSINFAAKKHRDQRRKDEFKTPYINHPIGVVNYLVEIGGVTDPEVLAGAALHDTVEDTDTSIEEIEENFGSTVRGYVAEVTDNKALPKAERKRLQVFNAPHKSEGAKLIKLGDKLYNLTDLLTSTPEGWSPERVQGYFVWAYFTIEGLRGTNGALENELDKVFASEFVVDGVTYPALPSNDKAKLAVELNKYYASMEVVVEND